MNNITKVIATPAIAIALLGAAHNIDNNIDTLNKTNEVFAATVQYKTTYNLRLRTGPGTNYNTIKTLSVGTVLNYVSESNGWLKVKVGNNTGWVSKDYVQKINNNSNSYEIRNEDHCYNGSDNMTIKYTTTRLNLRKSPSSSSTKILTMPKEAKLKCYEEKNGWIKVKYGGYTGWAVKQYTSEKNPFFNTTPELGTKDTEYVYNLIINDNMTITQKRAAMNKLRASNIQNISKIVINKSDTTLKCYDSNGKLLLSTRCAIGRPGDDTPEGTFRVKGIYPFKTYKQGTSKEVRGDSYYNPLKIAYIQYTWAGHGIHGTYKSDSIGKAVSDGCNRVPDDVIIYMFLHTKTNAIVQVTK